MFMDSIAVAPSAALKLVEVFQISNDIKQLQLDSLCLSVEQKVSKIFQATSTNIFHDVNKSADRTRKSK